MTVFFLRRLLAGALLGAAGLGLAVALALPAPAGDVLDAPARQSPLALKRPLSGIAAMGATVLAVGGRGTVLRSLDGGRSWRQAGVPVGADLTTVRFTGGDTAWAVGHDGVALRSDDAGQSWTRVLDGRSLYALLKGHYGPLADGGDREARRILDEIDRAAAQSATPGVLPYPFLDIWMGADGEGFLAGAFGFLLRTGDGGKTWAPWIERADNERRMHLYALEAGPDQELYLAGEQGLVRRYDRQGGRFTRVETPYNGTFFGLRHSDAGLLAYGLRGNAFLAPAGAHDWRPIALGSDAAVVATLAPGPGRLVFVTQSGQVLLSEDGGRSVADLRIARGADVLAATLVGADTLALARVNGVDLVRLPPASAPN